MINLKSLKIVLIAISALTCLFCSCKKIHTNIKAESKVHFIIDRDINRGDYITVPVTIEKQEFNFILDTGSEVVVVDETLRSFLGKSIKKQITPITLEGVDVQMEGAGPAKSFLIGNKISFAGYVGVLDLSKFGLIGYDGIIGMDILKHLALLLDFENNRIEFANDIDLLTYKDCVCSVSLLPDKRAKPFVTMDFGNTSEKFLVDTGLPGTSFLRKEIYDDVSKGIKQYTVILDTINGQREGKAIGVDEATLGNLKYSQLTFICESNSVIGLHFLKQHKKVVFDFSGWKIYLAP